MQFFVFIVMEEQIPQFDFQGLAQHLPVHIRRLKQPLVFLQPASQTDP